MVALLDRFGLQPSRALGQNFVVDPNTVRRIVRLAEIPDGYGVVEIGAGLGSLTLALVEAGHAVTAVELDGRVASALREVVAGQPVRVVEADARSIDWRSELAGHERWVLVANLPYNVATPLVLDLLDEVTPIERLLVMVQREVGERLAAPPGGSAYGIPSVKVAYWAEAAVVGRVPPTVFLPRPRVESALVRMVRRPSPATPADPAVLWPLVRTAFGQRRKMLRRSLAGLVDETAFEVAAIRPDARPAELGVQEWGRLADAVGSLP